MTNVRYGNCGLVLGSRQDRLRRTLLVLRFERYGDDLPVAGTTGGLQAGGPSAGYHLSFVVGATHPRQLEHVSIGCRLT